MIDYSQYSLWNFCPWAWYERYVGQRALPYTGQRSDPLCLGSLVHNALDNFSKEGKPYVDDATMTENNPTKDTYELALMLVHGYLRKYPKEIWPVERAEQPLRFPLDYDFSGHVNLEGLAKLDGYFYVPEDTTINHGIDGSTLTLARGWWAKEFKTKAHGRNRAEWVKEWQTKRQADFQILALLELLFKKEEPIQGVLVSVLEKPHEYTPRRKCVKCKDQYDLASFIPQAEGFMCPVCGAVQELSPYIPKVPKEPSYFRITVTRTPEQLVVAKNEIQRVAQAMERMRVEGMDSVLPNRDACVNNVHRRECEYHAPHTYGGTTKEDRRYVQIEATKYMGVVV